MQLINKKILVTGADGFIGSHLVEKLVEMGFDVKAFVLYNSFNSWGWLDYCNNETLKKIEIFSGDIRDEGSVEQAMRGCSVIFHLAALIAIPYSYISPGSYVDTNVKGTLNILQAARKLEIERVLITSTSEVYGTALYTPIDEKHPLQAQSPYSATKISADHLTESFYRSFNTPTITVRPFNTYGPRQSARAIIPTIITQILQGERSIKVGDLRPSRDFNYVTDTVKGFISLAETDLAVGKIFNIATGIDYSIKDVIEVIQRELKSDVSIVTEDIRKRPEKSEVFKLVGDKKLIQEITDWHPEIDFSTGIKKTIDWFKQSDNLNKYKSLLYTL